MKLCLEKFNIIIFKLYKNIHVDTLKKKLLTFLTDLFFDKNPIFLKTYNY